MLTRRHLLRSAVGTCAAVALPKRLCALPSEEPLLLRRRTGQPSVPVPLDFIGLGYEMSSAATSGLLSAGNAAYVRLVRNLGQRGVLRLGGIVADFTSYSPHGQVNTEPKRTVITRGSLQQLRGFLDAVEWTAIWSVNFGSGTLDEAIEEARDVAEILGPRLLAIELGNEVENYSHGKSPLRSPPYSYETWRAEFLRWRAAILAAVPGLRFAAPDTASSVEWVERMALEAHGDVQLLTTHYYRGDQRLGTRDALLHPDPVLKSELERLRTASQHSRIPWRMCETNSFFGGGRPGLSDTLAGALWMLDYMLLLLQGGCAGVNIETGVNQLGFISSYSPIQDDGVGHNTAGVPYYGMLAFATALAGASRVLPVELASAEMNITAYALGADERVRTVVLINMTPDQSARITMEVPFLNRPSTLRLLGPSLESREGITFGGTVVDEGGHWRGNAADLIAGTSLIVPPASAVVLRAR